MEENKGEISTTQKKVSVFCNGCPECRMDVAKVKEDLGNDPEYEIIRDSKVADIIIFMGCMVTQDKEDLSDRIFDKISETAKRDAEVVLAGCMGHLRREQYPYSKSLAPLVDHIYKICRLEEPTEGGLPSHLPPREFWQQTDCDLDKSITEKLIHDYCCRKSDETSSLYGFPISAKWIQRIARYRRWIDKELNADAEKTYTIKISSGCTGACSYCTIRLARGSIRSKPISVVANEFDFGLKKGYTDFSLVGTDIGDYGKDQSSNLLELLTILDSRDEHFTLRLRNVNPRWLIPSVEQFCELIKSKKIGYILSPVQSGSNRILERMNRGYNAEDYLEAIRRIRNVRPDICIKTQVIVGFPGETDDDFEKSTALFRTGLFDYIEVYPFTARPSTKAYDFEDTIPPHVIASRYKKLLFRTFVQVPFLRKTRLGCKGFVSEPVIGPIKK